MGRVISKIILMTWMMIGAIGCTTGHCRGRKLDPIPKKIFIFKSDQGKQCDKNSGVSVSDMANQLKDIKVYSQENRSDGKMHPMVCGASSGKVNVYQIDSTDLAKAKSYGFEQLPENTSP